MQEEVHHEGLTVREVMMYAADFKLGFDDVTAEQKKDVVEEIIHLLRLDSAMDTDCTSLSGGELKRLSIAQELVSDKLQVYTAGHFNSILLMTLINFR